MNQDQEPNPLQPLKSDFGLKMRYSQATIYPNIYKNKLVLFGPSPNICDIHSEEQNKFEWKNWDFKIPFDYRLLLHFRDRDIYKVFLVWDQILFFVSSKCPIDCIDMLHPEEMYCDISWSRDEMLVHKMICWHHF